MTHRESDLEMADSANQIHNEDCHSVASGGALPPPEQKLEGRRFNLTRTYEHTHVCYIPSRCVRVFEKQSEHVYSFFS